jgi:hypothetical protein
MDRQIDDPNLSSETNLELAPKSRYTSAHLMCRSALWGVAGFLGSAYFSWVSFRHVTLSEYEWPHDAWTAATYLVWIVLLIGLAFDTRCPRERLFFGLLVVNFIVGCVMTLWHSIPVADVRAARIGTGVLWGVAALISLTTLRGREIRGDGDANASL